MPSVGPNTLMLFNKYIAAAFSAECYRVLSLNTAVHANASMLLFDVQGRISLYAVADSFGSRR